MVNGISFTYNFVILFLPKEIVAEIVTNTMAVWEQYVKGIAIKTLTIPIFKRTFMVLHTANFYKNL